MRASIRDLEPEDFPTTITLIGAVTGDELWAVHLIKAPPRNARVPTYIPAVAQIFGEPVMVRVEFATGEVSETGPYGPGSEN